MSSQYEPIAAMAMELAKLPGVGPKTAQRLAYHLASQPLENVRALSVALWEGRKAIRFCETCGNYAVMPVRSARIPPVTTARSVLSGTPGM